MESPHVSCYTDNLTEEDFDRKIDINKVAWFNIKLKVGETEREKKEHNEAIMEQIQLGVVQQNGIPHGVEMPPPPPRRSLQAPPSRNPFFSPNASPMMRKVGQQLTETNKKKKRYFIKTKRN